MFDTEVSARLVRHRARGPVTIKTISAAYLGRARDPAYDPFVPVLWDLRGQTVQIALDEFTTLPTFTNRLTGRLRAGLRTAILVDSAIAEYGMDLAVRNPAWAADMRVFRDEKEALAWLGAEGYD
jgi:hypothetical protein